MKVCMLAHTSYEFDYRVRRYAEVLIEQGHEVDMFVLREKGQGYHEVINGVAVYRILEGDYRNEGLLSYFFGLLRFHIKSAAIIIKKHFIDAYAVIHVHNFPDSLMFCAILPKLLGAKIILDIHDIMPEFIMSKFKKRKDSVLYGLLILVEKICALLSDHVIISNHLWHKVIVERSSRENKCTVIMNYPNTKIFCQRPKTNRDTKFIMLYPGTMNWHQGLDIAIHSFYLIKDQIPEAEFHIYGSGDQGESLAGLVSELGLADRIFLNKSVPLNEIADIMAKADIGIVPKRNDFFGGEAFSTKILEFFAVGVPVVAARTRIDQYYFDESNVMFFEPENTENLAQCLIELYKNSELRKSLVAHGREYVDENSWEVRKSTYIEIVNSLVKK